MIILDYDTPEAIEHAAQFCAALFRQGIIFSARPIHGGGSLEIKLTGY